MKLKWIENVLFIKYIFFVFKYSHLAFTNTLLMSIINLLSMKMQMR